MNALVFVRNESSLPQKVRELAMLTTARAKDCPYIWNAHVRLGRQAGLNDALINALRDRESLPPMSVKEVVVIKLGIEFFQTNRVNQGAFDAALEQFGPQGLVELTTLMGQPQFDQAGCSPASPGTGGGMRLRVGVEDDADLDAPLVGAHQRPGQSRRMQDVGLQQDGILGTPDAPDDRVSRAAVGAEIDCPREFPGGVASWSTRPAEPPVQPTEDI
jgi:AhpD family alkylhydroperoxidase